MCCMLLLLLARQVAEQDTAAVKFADLKLTTDMISNVSTLAKPPQATQHVLVQAEAPAAALPTS